MLLLGRFSSRVILRRPISRTLAVLISLRGSLLTNGELPSSMAMLVLRVARVVVTMAVTGSLRYSFNIVYLVTAA